MTTPQAAEPDAPTVYEFVRDGKVVDRVQPTEAATDLEATRLGVAALEALGAAGRGEQLDEYWRVAGQDPFAEPPHDPSADDGKPEQTPTPDPGEPAAVPDDAAPARPAKKIKE